MDVGAVERLLRSLAFEGCLRRLLDGFLQQLGFNSQNLAAPKAGLLPLRSQLIQYSPWHHPRIHMGR